MNDLNEIERLVNESGNTFHCRVVNYLRERKWLTLVSPYYMDNATNKPREIDLIAEKMWRFKNGVILFKLFIECKYIPQNNVFWFSDINIESAKEWIVTNTPLQKNNMFTDQHHYLAGDRKVAKLFASKNRPNIENEVIYKALNQSLNAMVYLRRKPPISKEIHEKGIPVHTTVEMPVILCNSFNNFYRVEMEDSSNPKPIKSNFQLEVNYAYLDQNKTHRTEYFLIDIVDFSKFDGFLSDLEADKNIIVHML